jgi:hypothetical protein
MQLAESHRMSLVRFRRRSVTENYFAPVQENVFEMPSAHVLKRAGR